MLKNRKWWLTLIAAFSFLVFQPYNASASEPEYKDVMVVYSNASGKEQIMKLASSIENSFDLLKIVQGNFTADHLLRLKQSQDIQVIEKNPTTLETSSTTLGSITPLVDMRMMGVQNAWQQNNTGKGVKVAIFDTGVADIPALANVKKYSFVEDDQTTPADESLPLDMDGHGTAVAGIIAGQLSSRLTDGYLIGVAPDVDMYSAKVFDNDGARMETILKAVEWAIENNIDIINMSFGTEEDDAILYQAIKKAYDAGIMMVAAAGNDGNTYPVDYPAKYKEVIAVSSIDHSKRIVKKSNTGSQIEYAAPGEDIFTLSPTENYTSMSGTSLAVPHVVGMIALFKQRYPTYTPSELRNTLRNYAIDLGDTGRDSFYGYGLLNTAIKSPSNVSKLSALAIKKTSATLHYEMAQNTIVPVRKYRLSVTGKKSIITTDTNYVIKGLKQGTTYKAKVTTISSLGKESTGKTIQFTTPKDSASKIYVNKNKGKINRIVKKINSGKKLNLKTEFLPLYTVYNDLTTSQKKAVKKYRYKLNLTAISTTVKSKQVKATNLSNMKKKKYTTITLKTAIKPSALKAGYVYVNNSGKNITTFQLSKGKSGKIIRLSTKKALSAGKYVILMDRKGLKTSKGKMFKNSIAVRFTVK
ncbi:S8 family serine peptidase [Rummeliibacillus suwonensis]|uniref:S8 family serine peptidase n=1 Tax=Rummeliibacillus suwonensis TaxID=1306154 RepID=UPI001AAF147C|nr:S8 family serine peptidase [Rummeliibacillus suwonensis]MBO2536867.1 S8 family serine peptidase [Rummeliibacillus suwonensis]